MQRQRARFVEDSSSDLAGSRKFCLSKRRACGLHFIKLVGQTFGQSDWGTGMSNDGQVAVVTPSQSWHTQTLSESDIERYERDTTLGVLYRLWNRVRENNIPRENEFDPQAVLGDGSREGFLRFSTEAPNPMDYTFSASQPLGAIEESVTLGSLDHSIQNRELVLDLLYCGHLRVPIYQDINHVISLAEFHYRRLLLPVENDSGAVSGIFLSYRMIDTVESSQPDRVFL